ncbi:MAG: diguanylate cyclase [Alphaproteobacteria bacterium]|nr:diguanylate cyclase [Alphaproteobacteria bacterium]
MASHGRVLVLEQDAQLRDSLCGWPGDRGFESLAAGSKREAVDLALRRTPEMAVVESPESAAELAADLGFAVSLPLPMLVLGGQTGGADWTWTESVARPPRPAELLGRVESLSRLIAMQRELSRRAATAESFGAIGRWQLRPAAAAGPMHLLLVSALPEDRELCAAAAATLEVADEPARALPLLDSGSFDAVLLDHGAAPDAALLLLSDMRRNTRLYGMPVLLLTTRERTPTPDELYARGASDVVWRPVATADLGFRLRHQVRQNRFILALKASFREPQPAPIVDAATGLFNHGFLHAHLDRLIADARIFDRPLSVASLDVTGMRHVNERHGYAIGDRILRQVGGLLGNLIRAEDLPARLAGAAFTVALPNTPVGAASNVLRRLAGVINYTDFSIEGVPHPVNVRLRCGLASLQPGDDAGRLVARALENLGQ